MTPTSPRANRWMGWTTVECAERWWAVDFQPLQQQRRRDLITDCTLEVRYSHTTPLSCNDDNPSLWGSLCTGKLFKDSGRKPWRRNQKSQAFCVSFGTVEKGVYHSPHQIPRPQNHGTRPDRGQRGKGKWHHMTIVSFLLPRSLLATNSKIRQSNERQAKWAKRRTLTASQPVMVVAWSSLDGQIG